MVYEVRRTFDVVRRVIPSVVTRHIDRGYRGIVLRIRDSGPVNITQPAKCPASVTVDSRSEYNSSGKTGICHVSVFANWQLDRHESSSSISIQVVPYL